ncbi:T9SS type A sorting domain-containing protein [Tenacibaculum sp. 190524A05c]|uniref:T9SS type A sorting domain-containing protein n=1 Tax=Tenacibaculum platacis TaxID=3137852 RepID=UPI0032B1A896
MKTTLQITKKVTLFIIFLITIQTTIYSQNPILNFTDITNGPGTGLNDGNGEGAIVTIWGQNLGASQNESIISFKDSQGVIHNMSYIYYWKNADGELPSGPSNLFDPLLMQEIAVSIPNAASGIGEIFVTINGVNSNSLPFTIRDGVIYHVKPTGDNFTGDGSFSNPWQTISPDTKGALKNIKGGELIYAHDGVEDVSNVTTGQSGRGIIVSGINSSVNNQTALIAYPNSRVLTQARNRGINFYLSSGFVVSKYTAKAGNFPVPEPGDNQPLGGSGDVCYGIETNKDGRIIGNYITGMENTCQDGGAGAIVGGRINISNCKIFGNQIEEWGCDLTSKFEHTTYFTVREDGLKVDPYEFGWNYLLNNKAKYGIHQYDESFSGNCGGFNGTVKIHNNVVVNQRGGGLSIGSSESASGGGDGICWDNDWEVFNNIFINTGLGPVDFPAEGLNISATALDINDSAMGGNINIHHNLIYGFGAGDPNFPDQGTHSAVETTFGDRENLKIILTDNIFYDLYDISKVYFDTGREKDDQEYVIDNNLFYSSSNSGITPPEFSSNSIVQNPEISSENNLIFKIENGSPIIDNSIINQINFDIYGNARKDTPDLGPIEFNNTTLGLDNNDFIHKISLYPNPTINEEIFIDILNNEQIKKIELYNILGKKINLNPKQVQNTSSGLRISYLPKGIHIIKVVFENTDVPFISKIIVR